MTKWQSGDIITDKRWDELNNVYPMYRKIEIAADSPNNNLDDGGNTIIFDIQMSELQDLQSHGVICWFKDEDNLIRYIWQYTITTAGTDDTRAAIKRQPK